MLDKKITTDLKQIAESNIPANTDVWPEIASRLNSAPPKSRNKPYRKVWSTVIVGLAVIVLLFFTTPSATAFLEDIIKTIGGLTLTITDKYPWSGWFTRTVPTDTYSLKYVQKTYDFAYPDFAPANYKLESTVRVSWWPYDEFPHIMLTWRGPKGQGDISLSVSELGGEIIGTENIETLEIKGQDVAFFTGGWYQNTKSWDEEVVTSRVLTWSIDNLRYRISTHNEILPLEDIILMVESMLP